MDGEVPEYGAAAGMAGRDVQATLSIDDYCFTHELLEVLRHDEDQKPAAAASASTTNSSSNMAGESEMASWLCDIFQHQQQQRDYRQSTATKSSLGGGSSGSGSDKKPGAKAGSSGGRRRRSSTGKAAEQRRRDKINDKMRTLQQLMPNCTKTDKASTLEEVIQYIKSLQHQMQVLSNGYGLPAAILPPSGMVPTTCMQPVGDTFGGQVAPVALSQYPFAPMTMLARPQYSNSVPLALPSTVLYRHQIGSVNAAQQLARRRHLVSPSDLVVPTSHMGEWTHTP